MILQFNVYVQHCQLPILLTLQKVIIVSFQYTYDAKGKPVGVFVPINEWEKITNELKKTKSEKKTTNSKSRILKSIEKGMKEVNQIEKGKLKSIPLKQLLDAL